MSPCVVIADEARSSAKKWWREAETFHSRVPSKGVVLPNKGRSSMKTQIIGQKSFAQGAQEGRTEQPARSAEESAIRETISAWSQAANAKDLNKCVSFYTDDASVLPFNAPIATEKDQIRAVWSQLVSNPDSRLSWRPTKIEVAQSADLAYEIGTFDLTVADQTGKSSATRGKYVIAWKKQANDEWKAAADIFNTDK
jgi:uncharacterized protein (TIGR02246 family)